MEIAIPIRKFCTECKKEVFPCNADEYCGSLCLPCRKIVNERDEKFSQWVHTAPTEALVKYQKDHILPY